MNRFYSLLALLLVGSASLQAQSDPFPDHTIPAYKYQGSMQCTSQVVMNGEIVTDAVVAAYCGDDFRGKNSTGEDPGHPNHVYLTIYGDYTIEKQYIHFKVYMQGKIFTCNPDPAFVYTFNGIEGSTSNPYIIDITPVSLANDADNTTTLTTYKDKTCDIALTSRTLYKDGDWNTLCLPFGVSSLTGTPLEGATVMELDATNSSLNDNGLLTLSFTTASSIVAGKPYIVKWASGDNIVNPVFQNVTITSTTPTPVEFSNALGNASCQFVGQYSPFTIDDSNRDQIVLLSSDNTLGYSKSNRTLRSCRAHFFIPTANCARSFVLNFGEEETSSLTPVPSPKGEGSSYFSLDGRKLSGKPSAKGVYIYNGRKIVVK